MNFMVFKNQRSYSGAIPWNKSIFENLIYRKLKVSTSLPQNCNTPFIVNSEIKILPIEITIPGYNRKTEQLQGPLYDFSNESCVQGFYNVIEQPLDALKYKVKQQLAKVRYEWETGGISLTLKEQLLHIPTNREERHLFLQALQLTTDPVEWKFDNTWMILTTEDLQTIVTAIVTHVQTCFNWESQVVKTIDFCTSVEALKSVSLNPPTQPPFLKLSFFNSKQANPLN